MYISKKNAFITNQKLLIMNTPYKFYTIGYNPNKSYIRNIINIYL